MDRGLRDVLNDPKHSAALATRKALDLMGGPHFVAGVVEFGAGVYDILYRHHKMIRMIQTVCSYDIFLFWMILM